MINQKFILTVLLVMQIVGVANTQKTDSTGKAAIAIIAEDTTKPDYENSPAMLELRKQNAAGNKTIAAYVEALKLANSRQAKENSDLKQQLLQYKKELATIKSQPVKNDTIAMHPIFIVQPTEHRDLVPMPAKGLLPIRVQFKRVIPTEKFFKDSSYTTYDTIPGDTFYLGPQVIP